MNFFGGYSKTQFTYRALFATVTFRLSCALISSISLVPGQTFLLNAFGQENYRKLLLKEKLSRLWSHCYRLAVCLRDGSSTPECTLLTPKESSTASHSELSKDFSSAFSKPKIPANSLTRSPAADHALAYSITEEGAVIVGLATSDSELYVTFPPTVG